MKTNDINDLAEQLDEKSRSSILKLIDLKTESDMEKILERIDAKFAHIDARFAHIDAKFDSMDAKFNSIDSKLTHLEKSIGDVRWIIVIAGGLLTILFSFLLSR